MSNNDDAPRIGSRTRSVSESDSNDILSAVQNLEAKSAETPDPKSGTGQNSSTSNWNLSPSGSDNGYMETPMGTGPGTRALVRNNTKILERQHKVEMECNNLKRDIEIWIELMSASPAPELSVVLDGYERFKRRIQRTSLEAILKRLPSHYTFALSGLQVNILRIRKKAW